MNAKQFIKKLEKDGWYLEREGKGSHKIYKHPKKEATISVPYHGTEELGKGLENKLLKQAGLK
jgi:mRNA interferase HicA